ncbi:hypothetical protein FQA39_LY01988 [Lamprigera yunnana]|nr:hypothetical protein FQA39_LY01988 [Lamprigera yunnana]
MRNYRIFVYFIKKKLFVVKVMLRVATPPGSSSPENGSFNNFFNLDKRKKQVTLVDPSTCGSIAPEDRRVGVAAPKMFAFDAIFSQDDSQTDVVGIYV